MIFFKHFIQRNQKQKSFQRYQIIRFQLAFQTKFLPSVFRIHDTKVSAHTRITSKCMIAWYRQQSWRRILIKTKSTFFRLIQLQVFLRIANHCLEFWYNASYTDPMHFVRFNIFNWLYMFLFRLKKMLFYFLLFIFQS